MRSGRKITQISGYQAFIPSSLPPTPSIRINDDIAQVLQQANVAMEKMDAMGDFILNRDHIIAMYIRKEAVLSSQIEGTQASLEDIFKYEDDLPIKNVNDVEEVVNYIKALNHGMHRLQEFPMSIRLIKEIHKILMSNTRGQEKTPGLFRTSQNWIGAPGSTLKTASFVPPPPHEALDAIGQLELFLHADTDLPDLIKCALIHYQFETIHPFLDGNGRVGRLLITFYLYWKQILKSPLLYLSYYLKMNRQEYYDRLTLVREKGDYEQWILFFLKGVVWTCDSSIETMKKILKLETAHRKQLISQKLSTSHAMALLDYLFEKPYLSINDTAVQLEISYQSAKSLVSLFVKNGFLQEVTGKQRDKRYIYWEYLALLSEGT